MAYAHLKDEARTEDRLIRSFGHPPEAEEKLDTILGFIWEDVDTSDEGVVEGEQLAKILDHWNELL